MEELRSRGLTLYLASGTDHEHVLEEAQALKIDQYFNGGIFGALDDYENFSKEQVIRELILPKIDSGHGLLGFGDGYVEIENVKAAGGIAVELPPTRGSAGVLMPGSAQDWFEPAPM